jgi:hypothetical protein
MGTFLMVTQNIQVRLRRKIFNGISEEIYGTEGGRIAREDSFNKVRTALTNLMRNHHFDGTVEVASKISHFRQLHNALCESPGVDDFLGVGKRLKLESLMQKVITASKHLLNDMFTADDIRKFAALAEAGRAHYAEQGHNPEEFAPEKLVDLALLIGNNFSAYEKTLNHQYI